MCARFSLAPNPAQLEALIAVNWPSEGFGSEELRPTDSVLTVVSNKGCNEVRLMRWGLIPPWAEDERIGQKLINARSETAAEKPAFRAAFRSRRCILPATGFYEWRDEPVEYAPEQPALFGAEVKPPRSQAKKRKYLFTVLNQPVFGLAGLWESWRSPSGEAVESCTILTTSANGLVSEFHDRMPCILRPEDIQDWLDPAIASPERLTALLQGPSAEEMRAVKAA